RCPRHLLRQPSHGDQGAAARYTLEVPEGDIDLEARRPPIRIRTSGLVRMCRDDIPEQHVVLDAQLVEDAVDDRRPRLRGAAAGQLPLRRERDAPDPCAAVAGGLADEDDARGPLALEVRGQALAPNA